MNRDKDYITILEEHLLKALDRLYGSELDGIGGPLTDTEEKMKVCQELYRQDIAKQRELLVIWKFLSTKES